MSRFARPLAIGVGLFVLVTTLVALAPTPAMGQTGRNVLLIANKQSDASVRIADHYAQVRDIPADQRITIDAPVGDEISPRDYQLRIERPITGWFNRNSGQDRILYLVLTKGVPLRITGTAGLQGTVSSVTRTDAALSQTHRPRRAARGPHRESVLPRRQPDPQRQDLLARAG